MHPARDGVEGGRAEGGDDVPHGRIVARKEDVRRAHNAFQAEAWFGVSEMDDVVKGDSRGSDNMSLIKLDT
jgi:hypothetical protein